MPQDVAFSVGHETDTIKYLVLQVSNAHLFQEIGVTECCLLFVKISFFIFLFIPVRFLGLSLREFQVHYAHPFVGKVLDYSGVTVHMVDEKPRNLAAVLLFASGNPIPPGFSHFQTNMSCTYG